VYAWKKNGWKKKDNHPVANVDLLVMLEDLREKRKLVLRHVKAHTGKPCWESRFNDKVDLMAKKVVTDFLRQKQDRHNKKIFTAANKTHKNPLDKLVMSLSE
jgi:ribonuclease HI